MNNKSTIYSEIFEAMGMPIDLLILESIASVITLVALILIVIASMKIYRAGNIPGAKQILGSLIGSIVITLISSLFVMSSDEENNIITGTFQILLALSFLLGALGFLKLAKYLYVKNATPALKRDVPQSAPL